MSVAFVFALPLLGSRAGVSVAMVMLLGVLLSSGLPSLNAFRRSRALQGGTVVALCVFATGLYAAFAWTRADVAIEGSRHTLLVETLRIGSEQAPWGSGIGTFVQTLQRGAGDALLMHAFVNNAHNEYAQWWSEAGVAGVLVVALMLMILVKHSSRCWAGVGSRKRDCAGLRRSPGSVSSFSIRRSTIRWGHNRSSR